MPRLLLVFCTLLFLQIGNSQRNCGTMEYLEQQIQQNPAIQQNLDNLEEYTRNFVRNNYREQNGGVITIPVIVHVVYQNSTENISDNQINSQIQVLNDDFRRLNSDAGDTPSDFVGVAADSEIEFCLTQIVRVPTTVNSFGTNNSVKSSSSGGSDVINPAGAMNFWVCEIGGGILGYAQFPGGSSSTDGIVVDYRYFGTIGTATAPFDLGRTATHEVGHYLNLRHIWGDGGCNVDDFVSDTPAAGGPNYTGSPCTYPGPNSCRPRGKKNQNNDLPDMFQNYMDYSDDVCMNLFTIGQRDRMKAAISASRPGLLTSSCTGNPVEICNNGIDDDGDGDVDCADGDCATDPACNTSPEICDNGIDDDGDGNIDCADGDCATAPNCTASCDAPTGLSHTRRKGGKEGLLSWNAAAGALSYDVEVYNGGGSLHASGNVTGTSATVGGLTKNASYTWRVRSNCVGNNISDWADGSFNARLNSNLLANEVSAYPNPANQDMVTVNWDLAGNTKVGIFETSNDYIQNGKVQIMIRDLNGRIIHNQKDLGENRSTQLNTAGLNAGIYIIQIMDEDGYTASAKLVKL